MGCVHSSNTAQRVSFILIEIVEGRLDGVFEEHLAGCDGPQFELIRAWRERRKEAFPDDPKQWGIYHIKSYQDDTPTMVLDLFAEWFQSTMDGVFKELDVPLSSKGGGEFARAFEAIGGSFGFLDNGSLRVGPTRETEEDFAKDAKVVRDAFAEGSQVDGERLGTFLGRFEWINRFLEHGEARAGIAHVCRAQVRGFKLVGKWSSDVIIRQWWTCSDRDGPRVQQ